MVPRTTGRVLNSIIGVPPHLLVLWGQCLIQCLPTSARCIYGEIRQVRSWRFCFSGMSVLLGQLCGTLALRQHRKPREADGSVALSPNLPSSLELSSPLLQALVASFSLISSGDAVCHCKTTTPHFLFSYKRPSFSETSPTLSFKKTCQLSNWKATSALLCFLFLWYRGIECLLSYAYNGHL